ncbi:MAG: ATP-binding protein [Bacteroidia bacterium]|nr:ATP-binding protein [Bacteroidia bacterium]
MPKWALRFAASVAGLGILIALLNELAPLRWHQELFQRLVSQMWQEKIRRTLALFYAYRDNPAGWYRESEVLFLEYDKTSGQLRRWNTTRWLFPQTLPSLVSPDPEIISDEHALYYALKFFSDTTRQVVLLPIWIHPPPLSIHKRWDFPVWGNTAWIQALCFHRQSGDRAIVLSDHRGQPLLRLYIGCGEALRLPLRWVYLSFLGIAMLFGLTGLWYYLRARYRQAILLYTGVLFIVWQILHWTNIPGRLIDSELFSSESFAISPLHTSVWDLIWSLAILFCIAQLLPTLPLSSKWTYPVGYWVFWGLFGGAVYLIARHSQLEIDPLREPNLAQLACWGVALSISRQVLGYLQTQPFPAPIVHIAVAGVGGLLFGALGLSIGGSIVLAILCLSPLLTKHLPRYVGYILDFLLLIGGINAWISWGQEWRARLIAEAHASQVARLREPSLEYRLAQILPKIASDTVLWQSLSVEDQLIDARFIGKLIQRHLFSLGDAYEVVVSCWRSEGGGRADNLFELRPLNWRQIAGKAISIPLAPHLYFVTQGTPRYIYIARIPITFPDILPLEVQIELYPRTQPLLSRVRAISEPSLPPYALYEQGRLIRWWGSERFPTLLPFQPKAVPFWRETENSYEYIAPISPTLTVYLRLPARDRSAYLATFPIFLTLLAIGLFLERSERICLIFRALYRRDASFVQRFQALFGSLVFLPLIVMLLATFFLFLRINENQRKKELIQKLTTVSGYLSGEAILLEKLAYWLQNYLAGEESFVRDLMRRIGSLSQSEAFIYTSQGALYSSTLPIAYWDHLVSPFIDPHILHEMYQAGSGPIVEVDSRLGRLVGYAPLRTETGKLLGILHIPQPLPKSSFYEPLRYFIGYTVNAYLLLSLVSILLGLLLIERFAGGLQRVATQLRSAPETPDPPLLVWKGGNDEIATLVTAYNEMVERLRASQRQLERTLRRVSQQEMAFQAAHEIKTALTPLKIHLQHLQRMPVVEPDKLRDISTRLLQRIEALVRIANAFMNFAKLGSAEELALQPVNLNAFLEDQLHPFTQNPHITFTLDLPPTPLWIEGNPDALQQVLNNLLQNALQVLEGAAAPQIRVVLMQEGSEAIIAIQDNGPGIPPEVRERIFEFYFTTHRTGTGLGLAITKGLVERMNGKISFVSEVGVGTTFYVAFPLKGEKSFS